MLWALLAPRQLAAGFRPADPGDARYDWPPLDAAVRDAVGHRQHVVFQIMDAPVWAEASPIPAGVSPGTWEPNARLLGEFAHALAARYSGRFPDPLTPGAALPRVGYYEIWNEPNLPSFLAPQWGRTSSGAIVPLSPGIYRNLVNAAYAAIKSAQPHAYVIAGSTAPYGDPPGGSRMAPLEFLRELMCLHGARLTPESCPHPVHFDGIDHHPYAYSPLLPARNADDVSVPDLWKISRVLTAAARVRRVLPRTGKQLWVTEIGWDSSPPDHGGVTLETQARYLSRTDYELWRQGVSRVFWLSIGDHQYLSLTDLTGMGVYFANGQAKPAAAAFRFPFVALRQRGGRVTLWGRAPTAGVAVIEQLAGNRWKPLLRVHTDTDGLFFVRRRLGSRRALRAVSGSSSSLSWTTA